MTARQDYLAGKISHEAYYGGLVCGGVIRIVRQHFSRQELEGSTCPHLNDLPLCRWDHAARCLPDLSSRFAQYGDYPTPAGLVCLLKAAARYDIAKA